jgi:hypothetical protein
MRIFLELLGIALITFGFYKEAKIIEWEDRWLMRFRLFIGRKIRAKINRIK